MNNLDRVKYLHEKLLSAQTVVEISARGGSKSRERYPEVIKDAILAAMEHHDEFLNLAVAMIIDEGDQRSVTRKRKAIAVKMTKDFFAKANLK